MILSSTCTCSSLQSNFPTTVMQTHYRASLGSGPLTFQYILWLRDQSPGTAPRTLVLQGRDFTTILTCPLWSIALKHTCMCVNICCKWAANAPPEQAYKCNVKKKPKMYLTFFFFRWWGQLGCCSGKDVFWSAHTAADYGYICHGPPTGKSVHPK